MSSAKDARYERCVRYVANALRQNPVEDSVDIIRRRSLLFGLAKQQPIEKKGKEQDYDPRARRQQLSQQVDGIRANFWTTPLAELRQSLSKVRCDEFPDIRMAVDRLSTVARERDKLPHLTTKKGFDSKFFSVFREVLVAAPRDSAVAREKMVAKCAKASVRKRTTKMIRLIERELPALYQLESNWLDSLMKQKSLGYFTAETASNRHQEADSSFSFSFPWWGWIVGWIIVRALIRLMNE